MSTVINSTISELQLLLNQIELPSETRIRIIFEENNHACEIIKRKRVVEAMRKLRGSGNGNLLNALLTEREKDQLK